MEVKVLTSEPVIEIGGVKYHHHPNGGGLIAESAEVAETVYVGPLAIVGSCAKLSGNIRIDDGSVAIDLDRLKRENGQLDWQDITQSILRILNIAQSQLAKMMKVSHPTVSRWLSGKTIPRKQQQNRLIKLCQDNKILEWLWQNGAFSAY